MKKEFSNQWIGSKQPRKQRKFRHNAPLHIKRDFMSTNLSKDLRKKYGKRNFPIRKEDNVRIMIGEWKKKTGKIELVDYKRCRVTIAGINRTKKDGSKIKVWFHPSNLQIQELNLDDKKRIAAINRKANTKKEKKQEKSKVTKQSKPEVKK